MEIYAGYVGVWDGWGGGGLGEGEGEGEKPASIRRTVPLPRNLVSRIAVTPGIVVDGVVRVHLHVRFARAPAVQARDRVYDLLVLRRDGDGVRGMGFIIYPGRCVLGGVFVVVR